MVSKKARLFIFSAMLAFSLFIILTEKLSIPGGNFQRTEDVFSMKLHEGYGKYLFYYSEVSGKDISFSNMRTMTERIGHPLSWLYYSLLMKVTGNDREAFEAFSVFREKAQGARNIDNDDISLLSRILNGEISEYELEPVILEIENLEIGWFRHIVSLVLYRSLKMKDESDSTRDLALSEAYITVKKVLLISAVLILLFVTGIAVIVMSIKRKKVFQSFDRHRIYKLDASYLFETFILWLFIMTLLKVILTSSLNLEKITRSFDLTLRICLLSGIYVLPCVALLYLGNITKQLKIPREELYMQRGKILKDIAYGIGGYCAAIPLLFLSAIVIIPIMNKLEKIMPTPSNPAVTLMLSSKTPVEWILLFFLIACLAPVIEEVVFRGILQNAIKRKAGPWLGIFLSACIFSFLHPQLPIGFLPILVLGIVFGILAEARKSLIPSIVAHGINNGVIIVFVSVFT